MLNNIEISKELLSAVLHAEIIDIEKDLRGECLRYYWNDRAMAITQEINIYELSHKCKKWAFKQGYWLSIRLGCTFNVIIFSHIHSQLQTELFEVNGDTEVEAIIKACEWILKEVNK